MAAQEAVCGGVRAALTTLFFVYLLQQQGASEGLYTPLQRLLCPRSPYNNKNSRQNVHVLRFRLFQKATYHCSHNLRWVFGRTERLETPTEKWKGVKDHLNDRNL